MVKRHLLWLLLLAGLACLARGPLHSATYSLPVSNDDAIPLLMARQILKGELSTILWNQPYNGTFDAYLLAPGLLVASPHKVFRLYEAVCGIALVVLVGRLARRAGGEGAGWAASGLAALGTPYMALMAATGPTPNFLVPLLTGVALLPGLASLDGRASPPPSVMAFSGLLFGLALWDSALALPVLVGAASGLLVAGFRPSLKASGTFLAGLCLGASPLFVASLVGAQASSPVTAVRPTWLWRAGLVDLGRAAAGLLGIDVPLVVDGPEREALPLVLAVILVTALVSLVSAGVASRRSLPLALWGLALGGAFAVSRRTGSDEIRYLYGLVVPVLCLAGSGLARVWLRNRIVAGSLALAVTLTWGVGHRRLLAHWKDPGHAPRVWQVPSLSPVLETLKRAGVVSAYASLQFAGRLTLESEGTILGSQAWNERIPGDPLRFRDEVDLDPKAGWMLSSHISRGMPRAAGFRQILGKLGGSWKEDAPGDFVVFRRFVAPFDESQPVPVSATDVATLGGVVLPPAVLDRKPTTAWTAPTGIERGSGLVVHLRPRRRVSALVLSVDLLRSPLATPWVCEADGRFLVQGPLRHGFQWVNGVPRAGKQALLTVVLGVEAEEIRLIFQGPGPPLRVFEVFVYGPDEAPKLAAGAAEAEAALQGVRAGDWEGAIRHYSEAVRLEPHRASYHAALARAQYRAEGRRWLDVESLDDGGPALVSQAEDPRH